MAYTMRSLVYIALWSYVVIFSSSNHTGLDWDTILPYITIVCSTADDFGGLDVSNTNLTKERNPCCSGCSCDNDWHHGYGDCCPDMNQNNTACLKPSLSQSIDIGTYKFITSPPVDGCELSGDQSTCSSDVTVAPWGNFFPVYSKALDMNFKNEPCAVCNGADTNDIERWTSRITYTSTSSSAFVSSMVDFYETFDARDVTVVFDPPNSDSKAVDKRCYELIDECFEWTVDTFYIPSSVQLDRTTIIEACAYGPKALYIRDEWRAFKNIFCALCSGFAVKKDDDLRCTFHDRTRTMATSYTGLVDTGVLQSLATPLDNDRGAGSCRRPANAAMNASRCVQPSCPALQIRLPSDACEFPAVGTAIGCLALFINISTPQTVDTSSILNMTEARRVSIFEERNPWPEVWQIAKIGLLASANRTDIIVNMVLTTSRMFSMRQLIINTGKNLAKRWSLRLDGEIEFTQSISAQSRFGDGMTLIYFARIRSVRFCPQINNLFYCQQIELHPSEYKFVSNGLYLLHSEKVLGENEYMLLEPAGGPSKVRVCLGDSGYVRVHSASVSEHETCITSCILQWFMVVLAFALS